MALIHIASVTASASATVSFTTGIDATYNEYQFHCVNMHPATDNVNFRFQVNAAGASGFDETMTTTYFETYHDEADSYTFLGYRAGDDQAQGTAYQKILSRQIGNDADQSLSGVLTLYAPSSTTYVKHFTSTGNGYYDSGFTIQAITAGYINTTAAIDEISFKFDSGNIDAGTIHMYGVG
jgi:hypothetical protein|tara:strand:- start:356 stop:895 length:540 start_codon:yes stop_codon:yes gene_type:complete